MNNFLEKIKKINKKGDSQLILLSIIVSVVMWTFVTTSTNPSTNRTFRNIPVIIQNQDKLENAGYTIVSKDDIGSVTVRLTGSRDNIVSLNADDIQASINVMDAKEGINSLDVKIDKPSGIYLDYVDPNKINLNIQRIVQKTLPVNVVIADKLKDGKIVEVNEQKPKEIKIKGPESVINNVDRIEVNINEPEYLDGKIHNLNINVYDRKGKVIDGLDLDNKDVNLSFLVYETKKVKVDLRVRGQIANGYVETMRAISPENIIIKGQGELIKDIESISTKPVVLGNIKSSKYGEVQLDLPDGIEVYDGDDMINYKIEVTKIPEIKND
uniref:CdaR family protein n=1 Tax=Anaerococcus mediterraneensis TaxID=1870984 RepID=UPI0009F8129F|nr:CdaR family protein [Anaerococcus mediterraneensis]